MNNNYHTQLDKSQIQEQLDPSHTAVLQQMQNFQGTPIGMPQRDVHLSQGTPIGMPQRDVHLSQGTPIGMQTKAQGNPQLMQMLLAQQLTHQQQAQQAQHLFQQQQQALAQSQSQAQVPAPDEIELSETKSETKAKGIDPRLQRVTEHFQQMVQNGTAAPAQPVAQPPAPRPTAQPAPTAQSAPAQAPQQRRSTPAPAPAAPAPEQPKKSCVTLNYLIIPILILIVVMAVLHPKTAPLFDKFLPPVSSMTGMLARGGAVVLAYILTRFIGGFIFKC